jgi:hypothetical protein
VRRLVLRDDVQLFLILLLCMDSDTGSSCRRQNDMEVQAREQLSIILVCTGVHIHPSQPTPSILEYERLSVLSSVLLQSAFRNMK